MSHSLFVEGTEKKKLEIPRLAKLAEAVERASGFTTSDANDITARQDKTQGE